MSCSGVLCDRLWYAAGDKDDRHPRKQFLTKTDHELESGRRIRDHHVDSAAVELPPDVVTQCQRCRLGGKRFGLEVFGVIVDGRIGTRLEGFANRPIEDGTSGKILRSPMYRQDRSRQRLLSDRDGRQPNRGDYCDADRRHDA